MKTKIVFSCMENSVYGQYCKKLNLIVVNSNKPKVFQMITLLHEVVHRIFRNYEIMDKVIDKIDIVK